MKKLVIILLLLQLLSIASAVEIKLTKDSYSPKETLQAEIYGNFIDGLEVENIFFYRERNIPIIYDLLKAKDKYILYALLPSTEGNYTLKIKNTRYETDTGSSSADIIKPFQIKQTNETILSINPGFVITRDDFYIEVRANENIDIETSFLEKKQTRPLIQNKEERIYFSIGEISNYTETIIKINEYEIPVFIYPKTLQIMIMGDSNQFRFSPLEINATILKDVGISFKVSLINFGRTDIPDINITPQISDSKLGVVIAPNFISKLEAAEEKIINITFTTKKEKTFSGIILASSQNISAELNVNLEVTENKSEISYEGPLHIEEGTCEEIGGKICGEEEICDIPLELVGDDFCCKGNCVEKESGSSTWVYGIIIILLVAAGIIGLAIYMKKKQRPVDALKQREKRYERRMSGEVRGRLSRM